MADKTVGHDGESTETWTTGNRDKDWMYFQRVAEGVDKQNQRSLALNVTSVILIFVALALFNGPNRMNNEVTISIIRLGFPWLALLISACSYWKIFHLSLYRRKLEAHWREHYADQHPAPFGRHARDTENAALSPELLIVAAFGVVSFLILATGLAWMLLPHQILADIDLHRTIAIGGVILVVATFFVGMSVLSAYKYNQSGFAQEESSPTKVAGTRDESE